VQEALELTSRKPGYTFGFNLNSKSLNLKKQRKALSEARYNALEEFIKDNTTKLYEYKLDKNKVKNEGKRSQVKYEKRREELKQKKEDEIILINEQRKLKHKQNVEKNEEKEKERIDKIIEKKK